MPVLSNVPRDRLEAMLDAVDLGLWYCDLPFDELVWDARVKAHFWMPPDAVVTIDRFYEALHPDDREPTRAAIERSIATASPYDIEYRTCRPGVEPVAGNYRWIRAFGHTSYDDAGAPIRFDGVTVDITRQKQQEAAQAASEARFRVMADQAPVMIWVTSPEGLCTYLNRSWYEFTGQTPEEALGFGWLDAIHPEDRERSAARFLEAHARRDAFQLDYRLRRHDGVYRWAVDSASPQLSVDGEFLGYVGSVIDIHERKENERERERLLAAERAARELAERANRSKSQFLAVMSHELRTPLNAILGYSELLLDQLGGTLNDVQARHVGRIRGSGRMLLDLIEDVLTYARIEGGAEIVTRVPTDVGAVIGEAIDTVRPQAAAKGLVLTGPGGGPGPVIDADTRKLRQVLVNLLSNAVKFTDRGAVAVRVDGNDAELHIRVTDSGIGIPPYALQSVFEPFTQVDQSHTRQAGGAGLGLAISRRFTRMMGGELEAESGTAGTTFVVRLPTRG